MMILFDGREPIDFDVSFIPEYIETCGKDIYAKVMKYKPFFCTDSNFIYLLYIIFLVCSHQEEKIK